MRIDFLEKPIYGQKAAETWKELTGNYPMIPHDRPDGAVLFNIGKDDVYLVGFFGFPKIPDHVILFDSYLEAERFFENAKENPKSYRARKPELDLLKPVDGEKLEEVKRPKFQYEGSGSSED